MVFEPYLTKHVREDGSHTIDHYLARGGYDGAKTAVEEYPQKDGFSKELIDLVKKCNLRGRGGAGFPAGIKWSFIPQDYAGPKYLACNADESEPGTFKDVVIMTHDPHMLIEGIIICCWAVGIHQAYIYIRGEFVEAYRRLEGALAEAREKGFVSPMGGGKGIFGTDFELDIAIARGSGAYICGEETGLLSSLEGTRAYPKLKPPFPANPGGGLFGHPTVVNNVETLANLPHILKNGAEWFLGIGPGILHPDMPPPRNGNRGNGSKLVSICGQVESPGVYEIELGTPLRELIESEQFGGGVLNGKALKAVIPGGSSAPVLTAEEALDCDYDYDSVAAKRSMLGSGGIIVMDEDTCMVDALLNLVRFYHHESCGQCTPCREGCGWAEKVLHRVAQGRGREDDLDLLRDIFRQGVGRTVCVLFDACAFPVWSFTEKFREEFEYVIEKGRSMVRSQTRVHA